MHPTSTARAVQHRTSVLFACSTFIYPVVSSHDLTKGRIGEITRQGLAVARERCPATLRDLETDRSPGLASDDEGALSAPGPKRRRRQPSVAPSELAVDSPVEAGKVRTAGLHPPKMLRDGRTPGLVKLHRSDRRGPVRPQWAGRRPAPGRAPNDGFGPRATTREVRPSAWACGAAKAGNEPILANAARPRKVCFKTSG